MDYLVVKLIHQGAVTVSIAGFLARGVGAMVDARWVRGRPARTLPHIVDSVLLASALALAWVLRLNPIEAPWLLAKIVGVVVYIGLGMAALAPARSRRARAAAWLAALVMLAQIVATAITKSPGGLLTYIFR